MPQAGDVDLSKLRTLLAAADEPLFVPINSLCNEVETAAIQECRSIVAGYIERAYSCKFAGIPSLPTVLGAQSGSTRIHLHYSVIASERGYILQLDLRVWPSSPTEVLADMLAVDVNGVGRIVRVIFRKDESLLPLPEAAQVSSEIRAVVEDWYALLESFTERTLRRLTSDVVERLLIEVRSVVPRPHADSVWLYAIVGDHGFSLTDSTARRRVVTAVLGNRGELESSPLEAAISLIAVEEKRSRSFSDEAVRRGTLTDVSLPKTLYDRLIQDTERVLYGTETITAELIAVTPNKEVGIVAAFPKGDDGDHIIAPSLMKHQRRFQRLLDHFGSELHTLFGSVERLTKASAPPERSRGSLRLEPGYRPGRVFRLMPSA